MTSKSFVIAHTGLMNQDYWCIQVLLGSLYFISWEIAIMMSGADHFGQSKMAMYIFYKNTARSLTLLLQNYE